MAQLFLNNARGVLAESVSRGETLLKVRDHEGIPTSLSGGDYFLLTLFLDTTRYGANLEVVKVTAVSAGSGDQLNLTVVRGFEYPARIHNAGARLEARLTAQTLRDLVSDYRAYTDQAESDAIGSSKAYTDSEIAGLLDAAPGALDTLNELAEALGNDPDFATTMTNALAQKLDASSYTAADVLAKLLTVDGEGSGLVADTLRGDTPTDLRDRSTHTGTQTLDTISDAGSAAAVNVEAFDPAGSAAQALADANAYTDNGLESIEVEVTKNAGYATRERLRKQATLDLDFAGGDYALDDGEKLRTTNAGEVLTVERATPKWVFGPNGKLREVPPNTIARQWNPETGEPEGVLIEESRTNLLLWSEDFTQSVWQTGAASVTETAESSPVAGVNWQEITTTSTGSYHGRLTQTVNLTPGYLVIHAYAKAANSHLMRFRIIKSGELDPDVIFDLTDGTVTVRRNNFDVGITLKVKKIGDAWYLSAMLDATHITSGACSINIGSADSKDTDVSSAGNSILLAAAQLEQAPTPSSYIPTQDAPVTRAADQVSRELGSEYSPNEGTVIIECDVEGIRRISGAFATAIASWGEPDRGNTFVLYTSGGLDRPRLNLRIYGAVGIQTLQLGNDILADVDAGSITVAASYNASTGEVVISALGQSTSATWSFAGYSQNDVEFLLNRLGSKEDTTHSPPSQLYRDARYIPRALSEQELIELTS